MRRVVNEYLNIHTGPHAGLHTQISTQVPTLVMHAFMLKRLLLLELFDGYFEVGYTSMKS